VQERGEKRMKNLAVIQARMGSSRFPGKVLFPLFDGKCSIEIMVEKLRKNPAINQIVIATSDNINNNPIRFFCEQKGYNCFSGSEDNVLDRVLACVKEYEDKLNMVNGKPVLENKYELVIDLTADCPFFDDAIIEKALTIFEHCECDYISNCVTRSWFDGADVQVYKTAVLRNIAERNAIENNAHVEHTGWNILNLADNYRIINFPAPKEYFAPQFRLTLDYEEDGKLIGEIMACLGATPTIAEIYGLLKDYPGLVEINAMRESKIPGVSA
jgi:spore coat polysaccharide biosynthesis protein SpsF